MNRKLTIVAMVALAAMLIATPVLAAGSSRTIEVAIKEPTRMFMTATITDVISTSQIEVKIYMTNRAFREYRGETVDVKINDDTLCLDWVKTKRKYKPIPMDCGDLIKDNKVNIKAKVVKDADGRVINIIAKRVVLNQRSIRH